MNDDKTLVECFKKENPIRIFYKGDLWIKIDLNWKNIEFKTRRFWKMVLKVLKKYKVILVGKYLWEIFWKDFKKEWI